MNDATLQKILEVKDHPDADRLDLVKILGYQLVVAKNQFEAGETVVFIQPDSVLPENADWAAPYRKYAPGRIRAVRLRNEWSEGIAVPIKDVEELLDPTRTIPRNKYVCTYIPKIGEDVSELLGVTHYEPPAPQDLSAKGRLPFGIPKTDETRCLDGNTIIETEDGFKTIQEICEQEYIGKVLSHNDLVCEPEFQRIIGHSVMSRKDDWFRITLECGRQIIATSNHKFYIPSLNCYRHLSDLSVGDFLLCTENG